MAILIDPPAWPAHGTLWSHLVSDSDYEELHAFAAQLAVPRRSFDLDHYDVPASVYERALVLGARAVTAKDVVHALRGAGLRVRQVEKDALKPVRRRQYLVAEWAALGEAVGAGGSGGAGVSAGRPRGFGADSARAIEDWRRLGDGLVARWNEPHRSYHDEQHLEDVLLALDHLSVRGERLSPATLLAAWFHDAVYRGEATDELDSARLAVDALGAFDLAPGLVQQVGEFIAATAPAQRVDAPPAPLAHLLDADLSIFASPQHRYEQYTLGVRAEYAHVTDPDFAAGRTRILTAYLEQPRIYRTDAASLLWEARARENVGREIEALALGGAGRSDHAAEPTPTRTKNN